MKPYFALLHYPVCDKNGKLVVTSVTNTDLHDLSRIAKTYEIEQFFVITPLLTQIELCHRLVDHWTRGYGARYNHTRKDALATLKVVSSVNCMVGSIMKSTGHVPVFIATSAQSYPDSRSYQEVRTLLNQNTRPVVILFGTGWGIHKDVMERVDYILDPVHGTGDYNHLSVRCAAAIILDRLLGRNE